MESWCLFMPIKCFHSVYLRNERQTAKFTYFFPAVFCCVCILFILTTKEKKPFAFMVTASQLPSFNLCFTCRQDKDSKDEAAKAEKELEEIRKVIKESGGKLSNRVLQCDVRIQGSTKDVFLVENTFSNSEFFFKNGIERKVEAAVEFVCCLIDDVAGSVSYLSDVLHVYPKCLTTIVSVIVFLIGCFLPMNNWNVFVV